MNRISSFVLCRSEVLQPDFARGTYGYHRRYGGSSNRGSSPEVWGVLIQLASSLRVWKAICFSSVNEEDESSWCRRQAMGCSLRLRRR
jgi:hypothetical protein